MSEELKAMSDEEIKALADTELCVCHLQNDCPTHPKGDFGMKLSDTEINKACAELMGKCSHGDFYGPSDARYSVCGLCNEWMTSKEDERPFDPLNSKEDWASLVFYCVNEWEGWEDFVLWYLTLQGKTVHCLPSSYWGLKRLLLNQRALPTALALYEKEKEDA